MKFYLYVSETKVDMLFAQLPRSFLDKLSAELKFNIGVVATTLKGEGINPENDVYTKLDMVCRFIRANAGVGDVANPREYVAGKVKLGYGIVTSSSKSSEAFFGEMMADKALCLIGSAESMIGAAKEKTGNHSMSYYQIGLRYGKEMTKEYPVPGESAPQASIREYYRTAIRKVSQQRVAVDFFAKTLANYDDCVLASPIYVAMAE